MLLSLEQMVAWHGQCLLFGDIFIIVLILGLIHFQVIKFVDSAHLDGTSVSFKFLYQIGEGEKQYL